MMRLFVCLFVCVCVCVCLQVVPSFASELYEDEVHRVGEQLTGNTNTARELGSMKAPLRCEPLSEVHARLTD